RRAPRRRPRRSRSSALARQVPARQASGELPESGQLAQASAPYPAIVPRIACEVMQTVGTLIVGAGVTRLATASALSAYGDQDYLVLEASDEIGGWCKTVKKNGFVWDYSGHFFHFRHPEIERWLKERMLGQRVRVVQRKSFIAYRGRLIDYPFQKNIHQLPQDEFIDCLHDVYFARSSDVDRP